MYILIIALLSIACGGYVQMIIRLVRATLNPKPQTLNLCAYTVSL